MINHIDLCQVVKCSHKKLKIKLSERESQL